MRQNAIICKLVYKQRSLIMEGIKKFVTLSNGDKLPMVGLGTWQSKPGEVEKAVKHAISVGYRHIDCAYGYGNEEEVGAAIKEKMEDGTVKREDLFITSKLWNTRHTPSDVKSSLQESLTNLGVEYVDLYMIHWPHAFRPGKEAFPKDDNGDLIYADIHYLDTWKALEKCVDEGMTKALGLSNFNSRQVQDVLDNGRIRPVNLQVEIHPYFANDKLVRYCHSKGISVTAYSPLASANRPWAKPEDPKLIEEPGIVTVAKKYNKTPAQVVLRWLLQREIVVIPKSVTPSRIEENFAVDGFALSQEDMEIVNGLDKNIRLILPTKVKDGKVVPRDGEAPYYPFQPDIEF